MPTVFISHATANDNFASQLHDELKKHGIDAWVDHEYGIEPGARWRKEIQAALVAAEAGIFLLSPTSVKSEYCDDECAWLRDNKKKLYPGLIVKTESVDIPFWLSGTHYVKLTPDFAAGLAALVAAILGKRDIDPTDSTTGFASRLTGSVDSRLQIPMQGRETDLEEVKRLLHQRPLAPVTITGIGGVGKSRLAYEVVTTSEDVGGAIWHVANDVSTAEDVRTLLREHFELENTADPKEIFALLREHKPLIVIDNGESVNVDRRVGYIDLFKQVNAAGAPILLTGRNEWHELDALMGRSLTPGKLSIEVAASLATEMAVARGLQAALGRNAAEIAANARFHPRLIEWAVGKLRQFPAQKVIRELRELKSRDTQDAMDEMILKTVRQMVEESGLETAVALKRLNVCRGGFTYEAAQKILELDEDSDALDDRLSALRSWQFMHFLNDRYDIDTLVIEVVGEEQNAKKAHFDYYFFIAEEHHKRQEYSSLDVESYNLNTAFEWVLGLHDFERALWLSNACANFLSNRGKFIERLDWATRVAMAFNDGPEEARANSQNTLGVVYREHPLGDKKENLLHAIAAFNEALKFYSPERSPTDYAMVQTNLGAAYRGLSNVEDIEINLNRAVSAFSNALKHYSAENSPLDYASAQNNLGAAYVSLAKRAHTTKDKEENLSRAIESFEAALVYRTSERAPLQYAGTCHNLGVVYHELGQTSNKENNLKRALDAFKLALNYRTPDGAPLGYAATKNSMASLLSDLNDIPNAIICWREAEKYYRQMNINDGADLMLVRIADAEQHLNLPPADPVT